MTLKRKQTFIHEMNGVKFFSKSAGKLSVAFTVYTEHCQKNFRLELYFCKGYVISCSGTVISSCNVNVLPCPGLHTMFVLSSTVDTVCMKSRPVLMISYKLLPFRCEYLDKMFLKS